MEKVELSNRLLNASKYVIKDEPILDVGSDHAYLPIYLVQHALVPRAIAGEIVKGPFGNAQEKVSAYGLEKKISVRLGDGLAVLNDGEEVGTIFICGMGGILISDILQDGKDNNKLTKNVRLVLQPNNGEERLREWLMNHHFEIKEEAILEENKKIYEIIVADYSENEVHYTAEELLFGPRLLSGSSPVFYKKWEQELIKNKHILDQLKASHDEEKIQLFTQKINEIEKVIK